MKTKQEQRLYAKTILESLSLEKRKSKDIIISSRICEILKTYQSKMTNLTVGAYCPIQKEVAWYVNWTLKDARFSFPRIFEDKSMKFYQAAFEKLQKENWGISLPETLGERESLDLDVLIIPGLLFSFEGNRIGRGAGFYDRYLEHFQGMKIGVCYEEQMVEKLLTDKHDKKVDLIITDKKIYKVKG